MYLGISFPKTLDIPLLFTQPTNHKLKILSVNAVISALAFSPWQSRHRFFYGFFQH